MTKQISKPSTDFYTAANLKGNPFRTNATSEVDPRKGIWVGYQKEKETLLKYLIRSRSDQVGNVNFLMIYGELGTGKTHALHWAQYHVTQEAIDEFKSLAFYIPTLKKSKGQLSFAEAFTEDIVSKSSLAKDVLAYKQFASERTIEYKRDYSLPLISDKEALSKIIQSSDLLNLASKILDCQNASDVSKLLSPKNDYSALLLFTELANLFTYEFNLPSGKSRYKKAIYLFIDEADLLAESSAKEARDVNGLFRHLYDYCPNCFCMVLGFTATSAELGVLFEPYVLDRASKQIVLNMLQPDEAKEFVKAILDTARVDDKHNTGFFPFAEDAIEELLSGLVQITPRKIVDRMQQAVEEIRLAGVDPGAGLITTNIIDQYHIIEELG